MNKPVEIHAETLRKVAVFIANLKGQYANDSTNLGENEKVDILGGLDGIRKEIENFLSDEKKKLSFTNPVIKGSAWKATQKIAKVYEIDPVILSKELEPNDFLRCIKTVKKNVETFLPKARIEQIQTFKEEKISIAFESL